MFPLQLRYYNFREQVCEVSFNPFPSVVNEIPAYTQKLNADFLSPKKGINLQKIHPK